MGDDVDDDRGHTTQTSVYFAWLTKMNDFRNQEIREEKKMSRKSRQAHSHGTNAQFKNIKHATFFRYRTL